MYVLVYTGKDKAQQATLYQYYWKTNEWIKTMIGRAAGKTYGCKIEIVKGKPVVAGLYSVGKVDGYFINVINAKQGTTKEIFSRTFPADYKLGAGFIQPDFYSVSNVASTTNGNLTVTIEGSAVVTNRLSNFMFSPVLVQQIDSTGKDVWHKVIQKDQATLDIRNRGGHALITKGDDVIILYNDHRDNAGLDPGEEKVKTYRGINTVHIVQRIALSGTVKKEVIVPNGFDPDFGIDVQNLVPIEDNIYQIQFWRTIGSKYAFSYGVLELK